MLLFCPSDAQRQGRCRASGSRWNPRSNPRRDPGWNSRRSFRKCCRCYKWCQGRQGCRGRDIGLLQLSPAALQQMLAVAVAAQRPHPPTPPLTTAPSCRSSGRKSPKLGSLSLEAILLDVTHPCRSLLSLTACAHFFPLWPLVRSSPPNVFAQAEKLLLSHYQLSPLERGRRLYHCTLHSNGDASTHEDSPTRQRRRRPFPVFPCIFHYIILFIFSFSMDSLDEMAATATTVYQANAAALISSVASDDLVQVNAVRRPPVRPSGGRSASNNSGGRGSVALCKTHLHYRRDTFRCDRPDARCATCSRLRRRETLPPGGINSRHFSDLLHRL